ANFDRFLDYVEEVQRESELFCDTHLRLQTHNVGARHIAYARIGAYESRRADAAEVMRDAGGVSFVPAALSWDNQARRDSAWSPDPSQVERIEAIYREDYERFGYARTP